MSESTPSRPAAGQGHGEPELPRIEIAERGAPRDGQPQVLDRRLFMQLLVFRARSGHGERFGQQVVAALDEKGVGAVVYEDVNDPWGIGLLTWSQDPSAFVEVVRPAITATDTAPELRPEMTMLGRTYSTGYEQDLAYWMLRRPPETVTNPASPWAVWYPLRRTGAFNRLDGREQGAILREHGTIGKAYGAQDLAHDVRLACHGMDTSDNEFVIGLIGKDLYPLSHIVQAMRKTRQTSEYIAQMGPFFVGRVVLRGKAR